MTTPVWIAPLPDGSAGFATEPNAGKVKRNRAIPRVTLQHVRVTIGSVAEKPL